MDVSQKIRSPDKRNRIKLIRKIDNNKSQSYTHTNQLCEQLVFSPQIQFFLFFFNIDK